MTDRTRIGLGLVGVALGVAGLYFFDPATAWFLPPCWFQRLTGLACPGCGSTRALHQLAHGQFAAAWQLNPLVLVLAPVVILGARRGWLQRPSVGWVLLTVVVLFGIIRNVPVAPFTLLKP